jgi:hypothetical protein
VGESVGNPRGAFIAPVLVALASFFAVWTYFSYVLRFDLFRSDVLWYWSDSLSTNGLLNAAHVPGYPCLIALVRFLVSGSPSPILLMWGLNIAFHVLGTCAIFALLRLASSGRAALLGSILYALWPLVGTTYVVYPVADGLAMAFYSAGLYALVREKSVGAGVLIGLAMVTHKAIWPFAGFLVILLFVRARRLLTPAFLAPAVMPVIVLLSAGTVHYGSPLWILSKSLKVESESRTALPILDGLFGPLLAGRETGPLKALVVWLVVLLAAVLLRRSLRDTPDPWKAGAAAVALGVLFLALSLNSHTIWATVRFSRLLALPTALALAARLATLSTNRWRALLVLLSLGLFGTQLAYAWYLGRTFFR